MISCLIFCEELPQVLDELVAEYYASLILFQDPVTYIRGLLSEKKLAQVAREVLSGKHIIFDWSYIKSQSSHSFVNKLLKISPTLSLNDLKDHLDSIICLLYSFHLLTPEELTILETVFESYSVSTFISGGKILFNNHLEVFLDRLNEIGVRIDNLVSFYDDTYLRYIPERFYLNFLEHVVKYPFHKARYAPNKGHLKCTIELHRNFIILLTQVGKTSSYDKITKLFNELYRLPDKVDPTEVYLELVNLHRVISRLPEDQHTEHYKMISNAVKYCKRYRIL